MTGTINTLPVKLSRQDSMRLLAELEKQGHPWEMLYAGEGIFQVWIDGTQSAHLLDLNDDGGWCMRTHVEI